MPFMVRVFQSVWAVKTKYHTRWLINNKKAFLIVLEAGSLRSGCKLS